MRKWIEALARSRRAIADGLARLFTGSGRRLSEQDRETWEAILLAADIPVGLTQRWLDAVAGDKSEMAPPALLRDLLAKAIGPQRRFDWHFESRPGVVLIVGVNGSGKTTTAAKIAHMAKGAGMTPLLAATDTFRAAGSEQLRLWGDRLGCGVVVGAPGADAAAVAFDAAVAAKARNADVLIVDTAGRMHTREPLMRELEKMRRALSKAVPGAPHETWLVLDATIGNNALRQAEVFHGTVPLTGAVVTKLDGSSRAGFIAAVGEKLGIPILFAGLGERPEDLVPFDVEEFVTAIVRPSDQATTA